MRKLSYSLIMLFVVCLLTILFAFNLENTEDRVLPENPTHKDTELSTTDSNGAIGRFQPLVPISSPHEEVPVLQQKSFEKDNPDLTVEKNLTDSERGAGKTSFPPTKEQLAEFEKELADILLGKHKSPPKSLTSIVKKARDYYPYFQPKIRKLAAQILFRPDNNPQYYNGVNIAYPEDSEEIIVNSGIFSLHYVATGPQAASTSYASKSLLKLPEIRQKLLALSYNMPPGDGTEGGGVGLYDVYITDLPSGIAGFCSATGQSGEPWTSYIVIDNKLSYDDVSSSTTLTSTLAHEFFHSVQYCYDPAERSWWKETTAVWAQDELYDDIDDYMLLLSARMDAPHLPLDRTYGRIEYGNVLWAKYLSEKHGGADVIRNIWEKQRANIQAPVSENTIGGISSFLAEKNTNLGDALGEYGSWLYAKEKFEEGAEYPMLKPSHKVTSYPAIINPSGLPVGKLAHLSMHIIECVPIGNSQSLSITFDGENSVPFVLYIYGRNSVGGEDLLQKVSLNAANSGNFLVDGFHSVYSRIAVIVVNTSEYVGGVSYGLSLSQIPPGEFSFDVQEFDFTTSEGTDPSPKTLTIGNEGSGDLQWVTQANVPWISISPSSGTIAPGEVAFLAVTCKVALLKADDSPFDGVVTFSSSNAVNSPHAISVSLEITHDSPYLQVSPQALQFSFLEGADTSPTKTFAVQNNGMGNLIWSASVNQPWISISQSGGILSSMESVVIQVEVLPGFLRFSIDEHMGSIEVSSKNGKNSPKTVQVSASVFPNDLYVPNTDSFGHVVKRIPFQWDDFRLEKYDITEYYVNKNDSAIGFYVPFNMSFYDVDLVASEDVLYISCNGILTFEAAGALDPVNTALPQVSTPNALISPFWHDFVIGDNTRLYARVFDTESGISYFAVEFFHMVDPASGSEFTFQLLVFSNGDIVYRYETDFTSLSSGTIGIENHLATDGLTIAFNNSALFPQATTAIMITSRGEQPIIECTPYIQEINVARGENFSGEIELKNIGTGSISWSLSSESNLSITPQHGNTEQVVTISGSSSNLSIGQHLLEIDVSSPTGYLVIEKTYILLNVFSGSPKNRAIHLNSGWNAVAVPFYLRPRLGVANLFSMAIDDHGASIISKVQIFSGGKRISYSSGEGVGEILKYGDGIMIFCDKTGELEFSGDLSNGVCRRISAGENMLFLMEWENNDLLSISEIFSEMQISFQGVWENGWRRRFLGGEGKKVNPSSTNPVLLFSAREHLLRLGFP